MELPSSQTPIVYSSFDRFPSPKGAATHIDAFATALGRRFGRVDLLTVPSEARQVSSDGSCQTDSDLPEWTADGVIHHPISAYGANLFERVLCFRSQMWSWWRQRFGEQRERLPVAHFRSIFEGYPIAREKELFCEKIVFEVNGLPSIELKYRYPGVAEDDELLRKLLWQEQVCLDAADLVLTVSQVNAEYLIRRGVRKDRIRVIPNGVDVDVFRDCSSTGLRKEPTTEQRHMQMLYAGTMSAWQGVSVAIEALRLIRRDFPASLTLVGLTRPHQRRELLNLAFELGVSDAVTLLDPVSKHELSNLHHQADVVLAPLTLNDRNLDQGCCPLKVLEAMACGTPLVASDIPVVRELVTNEIEGLLVRPSSAKAIKDGILRLKSEVGLARRLGSAARSRVERDFTWSRAQADLVTAYEEILASA